MNTRFKKKVTPQKKLLPVEEPLVNGVGNQHKFLSDKHLTMVDQFR